MCENGYKYITRVFNASFKKVYAVLATVVRILFAKCELNRVQHKPVRQYFSCTICPESKEKLLFKCLQKV